MEPRAQSEPEPAGSPAWHAVGAAAPAPTAARAPGPERAIVVMLVGIALAVLLGLVVGARLGTLTIAVTLAVAGTWRAVSGAGPAGLVVRSRGFDVLTCWSAAVVIGVLALTAPGVG